MGMGIIKNRNDSNTVVTRVNEIDQSIRDREFRERVKKPAKSRLDQIADIAQQLTYTEMMQWDTELGALYSKLEGDDSKKYVEGSFAKLMRQWMDQNQNRQVNSHLDAQVTDLAAEPEYGGNAEDLDQRVRQTLDRALNR